MRDDRAFLGEALDVLGLLLQVAQRNEQREVGVLVAGGLEHPVEQPLHVLPERVAPRLDDHAAADVGVLGEIGRPDDLLIPLGKILLARWRDGVLLGHGKRAKIQHERSAARNYKRNRIRHQLTGVLHRGRGYSRL